MNTSQCRLALKKLIGDETRLMNVFISRKALIKGSVYLAKTKCGTKGCKCEKEGELHEVWRLTRSEDGKTKTVSLGKKGIAKYKELTRQYREFRQARARIAQIHKEQIEIINILEKGRVLKG